MYPLQAAHKLYKEGKHAEAEQACLAALKSHPPTPEQFTLLGDAVQAQGRLKDSLTAYGRANQLDPNHAPARYAAGCALNALEEYSYAVFCFRESIRINPTHVESHHNLGKALYQIGLIDEAIASFRAAQAITDTEPTQSVLATILPGSPKATHNDVLETRRRWATQHLPAPRQKDARPHSPLRIGYLSSFFDSQNWMKPVWGLINQHDRQNFQIHLFSDSPQESCPGYQPHETDQFHDITNQTNEAAAKTIETQQLDILIDLNAYSRPSRLGIVAAKPAPIVVEWFNSYATSGLPAVDYIIGDAHVIKPEEELFYTEKVLRVQGSYLTFDVQYETPPVTPPPSINNGHITFGCFASLYKLTPEVLEAWAQILANAPTAQLFLKNSLLGRPRNADPILDVLKAHNINPARVKYEGRSPHHEFLAAYAQVDIAFDPFPYNGGTTTTEAIWQGVPVLCFDGDRWAARQGISLLKTAGLHEFTSNNQADYIANAIRLANDPNTPTRLATLRQNMRETLKKSEVCDTQQFARNMEALYNELSRSPQ